MGNKTKIQKLKNSDMKKIQNKIQKQKQKYIRSSSFAAIAIPIPVLRAMSSIRREAGTPC